MSATLVFEDRLLNTAEMARALGVHKETLRRLAREGRIPCYQIGRKGDRRFRLADVLARLEEKHQPEAAVA